MPTLVIIGAGVVGSAVAASCVRRGFTVFVLERKARAGEGATSRNSGVIHAGIYYPPASLKAALCVRGRELLYDWCRARNVGHRKIGKLVVASEEDELAPLELLLKNAHASGATETRIIEAKEIAHFEPSVSGKAALWSPESGIVDPHELTDSLVADAEANGTTFSFSTDVQSIDQKNGQYRVTSPRGELIVDSIVNAAGLYADEIARFSGRNVTIYPWRGDYFKFRSPVSFQRLIYPVKKPGSPNLGIHLTIDLGGGCRLGPDADLVDSKEDFSPREEKREAFAAAGRKLFPWLEVDMLTYDMCGIRAKLRSPTQKADSDFIIAEDLPRWINLIGIESPGLTASLAIAEKVTRLLAEGPS